MNRLLLVGVLFLGIADRVSAQAPLDLLPQDVVAAIAIRDLDALIKKGDKFLTAAEIRMPLRPSELFDQGVQFLGVRNGYDRKASAAIILMSPEREEEFKDLRFLEYLVPVLPFTDADVMADNFGIPKGKLIPNGVVKTTRGNNDFLTRYAARTQTHIALSNSEKTLKRLQKSKSLATALTTDQRKLFDRSDVLLHFGRYLWQRGDMILGGDAMKGFAGDDAKEKEFMEQFVASLKEVENTVVGFHLNEGIDSHFLMTVPKDGQASKLFKAMKQKTPPSTLKGLPEGNLLFAQASSGSADQQKLLAKMLFNFMLEDLLINQKIVHHVDRLTYLGVFNEVWRHLQGNRLAVYQNVDEKKLGLFSAVAILDTEDAKLFLLGMKLLSKMAIADTLDLTRKEVKEEIDIERLVRDLRSAVYGVRQSANTKLALIGEPALPYLAKVLDASDFDLEAKRRARDLRERISSVAAERRKELLNPKSQELFLRPNLTFIANVEKRQEISVDIINIKITGMVKAQESQFTQLLGPDWDKVRLAIVGNQIVVLLGSDVSLFEATLRNLQKGDAGLASTKRLTDFHELAAKERQFEFHISVEGILRLITPKAKLDTPLHMTSIALTLSEQSLQVDARVPTAEVRAIARKAQEGMQ
jgi:hypothetical protein